MRSINKKSACLMAAGLIAGLWLAVPPSATAHDTPMPLVSYGNFGQAARCHRVIARAARLCFESASRAYMRCANAGLNGRDCDVDISTIQQRGTDAIARGCSELQTRILGYFGVEDAQIDLSNSCTQQAEALKSLLYGPTMFSGRVAPGPLKRDECVRTVSRFGYRVVRASLRERAMAFDRMVRQDLTLEAKQALLAQAEARIADVRNGALDMIRTKCTQAEFFGSYGMSFEGFAARLLGRSDCVAAASHVVEVLSCPAPVCGNGVKEPGEECDDGNDDDTDACDSECKRTDCESFASTYDLIQKAIFEQRNCTHPACHGSDFSQGGLDLRAPQSYDNLVRAPSLISGLNRVEPLSAELSFLIKKLAAGTLGTAVEGSPMPSFAGFPGERYLTTQELEAMRLWVYSGAPRTGVVDGTATLLDACLPPADPIQIDPPAPPPPGQGVQLHMPLLELPPESETEVCFASYYDFSDQIPAGVGTDYGAFRYKSKVETQDPLSHHLIIHAYLGQYDTDHPSWGAWTCKGGLKNGQACEPKDPNSCGSSGICGSEPRRSVACLGFGPPDYNATTAPAFGGAQQPLAVSRWATGVYSELPSKGIIVWNSHAFNLTKRPAKVEAWVNLDFAKPPEQQYRVQGGILDPDFRIFAMNVPPFQEQEVCHQFTFPRGARLFEITSHMHSRGRLFRIWEPDGDLIYTSTQYNDPVQLIFDPPLSLDAASAADRTYRYCAVYDNGKTDPSRVKRSSTSPPPPPPFPPVSCSPSHCAAGKVPPASPPTACMGSGQQARDRSCDSSPGALDGRCDACTLTGGVTTEDEMFLFLAYYYCSPDFPDTCKDEYGFLGGGGGGGGAVRTLFRDHVDFD